MNIIQKVQKLAYTSISNNTQNIKVYSCSNKDIKFPYIILELEKTKSEENFINRKYDIWVNVKIFDKNETNTKIIGISDEISENMVKLSNIVIDNFIIVDVICENNSLEMYNGLNSVWNNNLKFKFTVNEVNDK